MGMRMEMLVVGVGVEEIEAEAVEAYHLQRHYIVM